MRRTNPCWPVCLGPGRTAGCHATCPEWAQYETEKFEKYEEHQKELMANLDIEQHITETINRMKRGRKK